MACVCYVSEADMNNEFHAAIDESFLNARQALGQNPLSGPIPGWKGPTSLPSECLCSMLTAIG